MADDTISRKQAIEAIINTKGLGRKAVCVIEALPPAQPNPWITCFDCPLSHGCPVIRGCTNYQAEQYAGEIPPECPLNKVSVQPQRIGHWIPHLQDARGYADEFECSACKRFVHFPYPTRACDYEYCPYCNAKMEENNESD